MIPKHAALRVIRPTDNLEEITKMYVDGLGFEVIGGYRVVINHGESPF